MLEWFLAVSKFCRTLTDKAHQAGQFLEDRNPDAAKMVNGYMRSDFDQLDRLWLQVDPEKKARGRMGDLSRHIGFGQPQDYRDIIMFDIPDVLATAEDLARAGTATVPQLGFEGLLHPAIVASSLALFRQEHWRLAVLDGVTAVFELIRARTGIKLDGAALIGEAFGLARGRLALADLSTDTGKNQHSGFMQMFNGIYGAVRNPTAHTLEHDLDATKAARYLVISSVLAQRVEECVERPYGVFT